MVSSTGIFIGDFSGGVNQGVAHTSLEDNQLSQSNNWLAKGKKLYRRASLGYLNDGSGNHITHSQDITGIFQGSRIYLFGNTAISSIPAVNSGAVAALSNADGLAIGSGAGTGFPWSTLQYKGVVYAARRGAGGMRRIASGATSFSLAGIPAPTTNAGLGDNGAGAIGAGDTYGYYTFYNTVTGAESNPSPVSPVLALANNRQIAWTSIDLSTDPQVNARRLYRTTPGAAPDSPALFIGQINDNTTTVFADNVPVEEMGEEMKVVENGEPDLAAEAIELHYERLFLTNGRDVAFSEFGLPESFDPTNVLSFAPDDVAEVRALKSYNNILVVGKTNKVYGVSGISPEDFNVGLISEDFGCYSHHSMQVAGSTLIWFTGETFVRYDGGKPVDIASVKLKETLAELSPIYKQFVVATVDPVRDLYIVSLPNVASVAGGNNQVLAYNYKNDAWHPLDYDIGGFACFATVYDPTSFSRGIYTAHYDSILYELFAENGTVEVDVSASLLTKSYMPGGPGKRRAVRRVYIQGKGNGVDDPSVTVGTYYDDNLAQVNGRTEDLPFTTQDAVWLNTFAIKDMGNSVAMGVSTTEYLEIEALAMEVYVKEKRVKVL